MEKKELERWYSIIGITTGIMGALSLVIRIWILNLEKEKKVKYRPPRQSQYQFIESLTED